MFVSINHKKLDSALCYSEEYTELALVVHEVCNVHLSRAVFLVLVFAVRLIQSTLSSVNLIIQHSNNSPFFYLPKINRLWAQNLIGYDCTVQSCHNRVNPPKTSEAILGHVSGLTQQLSTPLTLGSKGRSIFLQHKSRITP